MQRKSYTLSAYCGGFFLVWQTAQLGAAFGQNVRKSTLPHHTIFYSIQFFTILQGKITKIMEKFYGNRRIFAAKRPNGAPNHPFAQQKNTATESVAVF
jgi:hypothetical protein